MAYLGPGQPNGIRVFGRSLGSLGMVFRIPGVPGGAPEEGGEVPNLPERGSVTLAHG